MLFVWMITSIENTSTVLQNHKKNLFAILHQQLTIWGQSSELKNFVTKFQPPFSPWRCCFSAMLTADFSLLDLWNTQKLIFVHLWRVFIYKDTSQFALAYEQKKTARVVNLHLVVKISTGQNLRTYEISKKFFFLGSSLSKSNKIYKNKEILKRRDTNFYFFLKFDMEWSFCNFLSLAKHSSLLSVNNTMKLCWHFKEKHSK